MRIFYKANICLDGYIGFNESLLFSKQTVQEAEDKLKDLVTFPIISSKSKPSERYIPPKKGSYIA